MKYTAYTIFLLNGKQQARPSWHHFMSYIKKKVFVQEIYSDQTSNITLLPPLCVWILKGFTLLHPLILMHFHMDLFGCCKLVICATVSIWILVCLAYLWKTTYLLCWNGLHHIGRLHVGEYFHDLFGPGTVTLFIRTFCWCRLFVLSVFAAYMGISLWLNDSNVTRGSCSLSAVLTANHTKTVLLQANISNMR